MKQLITIFIFCMVSLAAMAQETADPVIITPETEVPEEVPADAETTSIPLSQYHHEQVAARPVTTYAWQKAANGFNYSDDVPEIVKKKEAPVSQPVSPNFNWDPSFWSGLGKTLSIIILIIVIGIVVYKMIEAPANKAVRAIDGTPITFDNLDAYIQETDLERFLREALSNGNYNQAVRIYYLQVIKDLSQKEAIHWSREKTNRDYLREMSSHPANSDFRAATLTYEEVWYGNIDLDRNLFSNIETRMKQLLQKIS